MSEASDIQFPAQFQGKETQINAYLALPPTGEAHGSVIIVHEIFGLTAHIKEVAARVAQAGFIALAPDMYTRGGPPPAQSAGVGPLREFAGKIEDARLMADLDGASAFLRAQVQSNGKVGILGFCWGGRVAMLYNAHAALDAAVVYYGRITGDTTANQPRHPINVVSDMHAPLQGHFGREDTIVSLEDVERLRVALQVHGKLADIQLYDHAGHGFNNDTREELYRPDAASLAFQRTLHWFDDYLGDNSVSEKLTSRHR